MPSMPKRWWFVCRVTAWEFATVDLEIVSKHPTRQWALDDLLRRFEAKDGETYVIVERDEKPSWDSSTYGPRPMEVTA